jgi:peroxiredoxin
MFRLISLTTIVMLVAGCAPRSGVVTGAGPAVGSAAPDVQYISQDGQASSLHAVRSPVTVVAFVQAEGSACCWLEPRVVELSDRLDDLPVTVAQFALPEGDCPHGQACVETCNLRDGELIALCDAQRLAWNAYGRPKPSTLILIGPDKQVMLTGSLDEPAPIMAAARELGEQQKQSRPIGDRREIY